MEQAEDKVKLTKKIEEAEGRLKQLEIGLQLLSAGNKAIAKGEVTKEKVVILEQQLKEVEKAMRRILYSDKG